MPRKSFRNGVNNFVSDHPFLRLSVPVISGTGRKHTPRTSSGGEVEEVVTQLFGSRPQRLAAPPAREKNLGNRLFTEFLLAFGAFNF